MRPSADDPTRTLMQAHGFLAFQGDVSAIADDSFKEKNVNDPQLKRRRGDSRAASCGD